MNGAMKQFLRRVFRLNASPLNSRGGRLRLGPYDLRMPIYAIGDIHGCYKELLAAEARIHADRGDAEKAIVVYLGDYIDRGPHSSLVLDHLSQADHNDGLVRVPLCGNHDDTFLKFIADPASAMSWLDYGGDATLHSYGIDAAHMMRHGGRNALSTALRDAVPQKHTKFLADLPVCIQIGGYLFVHAGVRPGIALDDQTDEDLMWIREPFLGLGPETSLTVVHGHTPVEEPVFGRGRIGIDTACFATGRLSVLKVAQDGATLL